MAEQSKNVLEKDVPKVVVEESSATMGEATGSELLIKFHISELEVETKHEEEEEKFNLSDSSSSPSRSYAAGGASGRSQLPPSDAEEPLSPIFVPCSGFARRRPMLESPESPYGRRSQPPLTVAEASPIPIESSSEEEDKNGEKRKKKKKGKGKGKDKKTTIVEGDLKTEKEKRGFMEKLKEKLPRYGKKPKGCFCGQPPLHLNMFKDNPDCSGGGSGCNGKKEVSREY